MGLHRPPDFDPMEHPGYDSRVTANLRFKGIVWGNSCGNIALMGAEETDRIHGPKGYYSTLPPDREAALRAAVQAEQVRRIRDIFGNPFKPASADPKWFTAAVVGLARTMYDSRDSSAMPVLADALEEAECGDQEILGHCRSDGPHVRGCWVVDLLLGKE